ncbi:tetratricopeptide repeat protein [Halostella litorea]|uniref:tetratricopeptide repeat protein n=1 Tax=Halostella litorea TaxID=2528831 RepID=UPI001386A79A|nr:tetratricopeptide repeat protein [Halostella litorea]
MDADEVPWIALVEERLAFLDRLSESPAHKPQLETDLDCSRSTVDRAIRRLEAAGLVDRVGDGYVTTPTGRVAAHRYRSYVADQRTVDDAQAVLSVLPPDCDVPPELVAGGTVATADDRPHRLFERLARHLRTADRYQVALPTLADSRHLRLLHARVLSDGLDADLLVAPALADRLREEFPSLIGDLFATESCTIRRADVPPFVVALSTSDPPTADPAAASTRDGGATAIVATHDEGALAGTIENDADAAIDRARTLFASLGENARSLVSPPADRDTSTPLPADDMQTHRALADAGMTRLDRAYFTECTPGEPETAWRLGFDLVDAYYGYAVGRVDPSLDEGKSNGDAASKRLRDPGDLDGEFSPSETEAGLEAGSDWSLPTPPDVPQSDRAEFEDGVAIGVGSENGETSGGEGDGEPDKPRASSSGSVVSSVLVDRLAAGDDHVVLGPPGSGKSTVCRRVACRWVEAGHGPVFYREGDTSGSDLSGLKRVVTAAEGHALVVVEDAAGPVTEPTLEFLRTVRDDPEVTVLLEGREGAWRGAVDDVSDPRLRDLARRVLRTHRLPDVDERTCLRAIAAFEAATGLEVPLSPAALYDRVTTEDGIGEMYVLSHQIVAHAISAPWLDDATAPSALEGDVRAVYDALAPPEGAAEKDYETLPLEVGLLVAVLTAAERSVTPGLVHAVAAERADAERADRAHRRVEEVLDDLDGRLLLRREDSDTYRTQHPRWAIRFLEHATDRAERETVALFERAINAVLALADDPERREHVSDWLGFEPPSVSRLAETESVDELVESLFGLAFSHSTLAPLFGTTKHSGIDLPDACSTAARLESISCRGKMWYDHGDADRGETELSILCDRAAEATDEGTRSTYLAEGYRGLGEVVVDRGETETAREFLDRSLAAARDGDDPRHEVGALNSLAWVAMTDDDYERAQEHLDEALAVAEDLGPCGDYSDTLYYLARLERSRGDLASAEERLTETIALDRAIGNRQNISSSLKLLAEIAAKQGGDDRAERYYRRSIELKREVGDRPGLAKALYGYGDLVRSGGDTDAAERAFERSLELAQENNMRRHEGRVLGGLGRLALDRADLDAAADRFRDQRAIHADLGYRRGVADATAGLGDVATERDALERARERYRESVGEYREVGDRRRAAERMDDLIEVCRATGDEAAALEWAETAVALCSEAELPDLTETFRDHRDACAPESGQDD